MRRCSIFGWLARAGGLGVLAGAQLVFTATGASGAVFDVTNGDDAGAGSLRQAFIDASNTGGDDTIVVDDAVNTVTLTSGLVAHAPVDNAALTLQGNGVTIQQNTAESRVIGNTSSGLLTIDSATITGGNGTLGDGQAGAGIGSVGPVTITSSIVTNNTTTLAGGGGIGSQGAVTLTNSTVSNNTAGFSGGGITAGGAVTLNDDSAVSDNIAAGSGGGIIATGAVVITDSSVNGNDSTESGGFGSSGGISGFSTVTITNSTVNGNTATATNGGGAAGGVGSGGAISATNSTVSGNTATANSGDAAGGLGSITADVTLMGSTLTGNGANTSSGSAAGGAGTLADLSATNSTVTGNTSTATTLSIGGLGGNDVSLVHATVVDNTGANAANVSAIDSGDNGLLTAFGSVIADPLGGGTNCLLGTDGTVSSGYNFVDDMSCDLLDPTDNQNVANDPMLGALADNGGPTETRAPLAGSPLINGIPPVDCDPAVTTDQRGVARPKGDGCDIGAVEILAGPFMVTNGNDAGPGSLRQAFADAATFPGDDVVIVNDAVNTITLTTGEVMHAPADNAGVTLQGNVVTIQQNTVGSRVIFHGQPGPPSGTLTIDNTTITGGNSNVGIFPGGGVSANSSVVLTNATITGNTVSSPNSSPFGGGIFVQGAVTLTNSTVSSNTASGVGGGIASNDAVTLTNSIVTGNDGGGTGGIYTTDALTVTNSTIQGNDGTFSGGNSVGGASVSTANVTNSTISGNTAATNGGLAAGGLGLVGAATIEASTISGNSVTGTPTDAAGGVGSLGGDVTATNSTVSGNTTAAASGDDVGGIGANDVTLLHSTVVENTGADAGNVSSLDGADNGSLTSFGSVLADPGSPNCVVGSDGTSSGGYNFADDMSCVLVDLTDDQNAAIDPMLAALADNGGPTETRLPGSGSPLLDAIPVEDCSDLVTTDQRGITRPQGAGCDIGAVEVEVEAEAPGAPTDVSAVAGDGEVSVSWVAPVDDGGSEVTGYTVTASVVAGGGGAGAVDDPSCSPVLPGPLECVVSGLVNGTDYEFSVVAENSAGPGAGSVASNVVTPLGWAGHLHPVVPARILDTRDGTGFVAARRVDPGETVELQVTGEGGVPESGVAAVVLNVTVTAPTGPGFLTIYPSGDDQPLAANLNFVAGETIPNLVTAKVGDDGKVAIFNHTTAAVHVIADVNGWFSDATVPDGARLQPVVPARILDTRDGTGFVAARRVNPGETVAVQVAGEGGVPTEGVEGVVLNVTVTDPTLPGFLTVYPSGEDQPLAANLNFVAGQTIPNLVTAKVGADGKVAIFNHTTAAVHVIADVNGWYSNTGVQGGARLEPLVPERILDTRDGTGFVAARRVNPGETVALQVTGEGGVPPDGVAAVVLNVTVTDPTGPGFLTVYPSGETQPLAANLNFVAGQTIPNLVVAKIGADGKVAIFNHTTAAVHVIADVNGYYNTPGP